MGLLVEQTDAPPVTELVTAVIRHAQHLLHLLSMMLNTSRMRRRVDAI